MAREHLRIDRLMAFEVTPYQQIRPEMRSGDLALFIGRGPISRAIQVATGSPFSHAGIVRIDEQTGRVMLAESVEGQGVHIAPFSKLVWGPEAGRYAGAGWLFRHLDTDRVTPEDDVAAWSWALDTMAEPYGYRTLVGFLVSMATGLRVPPRPGSWICSQWAAGLHLRRRLTLEPPQHAVHSPRDLAVDPHYELIARFL